MTSVTIIPSNPLQFVASHPGNFEVCWTGDFKPQGCLAPPNWKMRIPPGHFGFPMPPIQERKKGGGLKRRKPSS